MSSAAAEAHGIAVAWGSALAMFTYGSVRIGEKLWARAASPTEILLTEHASYFPRVAAALLVGAIVTVGALPLTVRHPRVMLAGMPPALAIAATTLVLTTLFWP